jgi:hypothetical protein
MAEVKLMGNTNSEIGYLKMPSMIIGSFKISVSVNFSN